MTALRLARELLMLVEEYGDNDVMIELLTENNSNKHKITDVIATHSKDIDMFIISHDIVNVKEFKKSIK